MPKLTANGIELPLPAGRRGARRRPDPRRHGRPVDLVPVRGHGSARPVVPGDGVRPPRPRLQRRAARDGYTSADQAGDALAIMDALEIDRAMLVGHSFGAVIAMHAAVLYPDRIDAVVLSDPCFPRCGTWRT